MARAKSIPNVSIYKPARRSGVKHRWLVAFYEDGVRHVESVSTDLGVTRQYAIEVSRRLDRKALGLITDADEKRAAAEAVPLLEHAAGFRDDLIAKGKTPKQARELYSRLVKVFEWTGFTLLSQLQQAKVQVAVSDWRDDNGRSAEIANKYLKACKQFSRWLKRNDLLPTHPLEFLQGWNVAADRRHVRRALTVDELGRLLAAALAGPDYQGMSGADRRMLYLLAAYTGLRRSELASLTPESFQLDGDRPAVTVEAGHSKHRRRDEQPLGADEAAELRVWLAGRPARRRVFAIPEKAFLMLYEDLAAAGIPIETPEGIADFHALRHTFITLLGRMVGQVPGVTMKSVMQLARHSDIRLTERYMHMQRHDEVAAIEGLPRPARSAPPEQQKATGTYGAAPADPQRVAQRDAVPPCPAAASAGPTRAEAGAHQSGAQPLAPASVYGVIGLTDNLGLRSRRLEVRALSGTLPQPPAESGVAPPTPGPAAPADPARSAPGAARPDPAAPPLDLDAIRRLHEQLGALLGNTPREGQ